MSIAMITCCFTITTVSVGMYLYLPAGQKTVNENQKKKKNGHFPSDVFFSFYFFFRILMSFCIIYQFFTLSQENLVRKDDSQ